MDLNPVLTAIEEARNAVASQRNGDRSESQRRLAILATQLELVAAFAEYVVNSIPAEG